MAAFVRQAGPMGMAAELGLFLLLGAFLAITGAFGTVREPVLARSVFWLVVVVGGGLVGIAIEAALPRRIANGWTRSLATAAAMTPPVALLVFGAMIVILRHDHGLLPVVPALLGQVFVIALAVMGLRRLVRRPTRRIVEARTVIAPPLPEAEAGFRSRLSAKRRSARLFAVEAHDHYVRVHTDAGAELIGLRFADAVAELAGAHGYRVHRSWWVSDAAIKAARWRRGRGEVELEDGLTVPVSRSGAPVLRAAGWL